MMMIDVSKEEAEKIATNHVAGTRYRSRGFEGTVKAIRFGNQRSEFKLETIRVCEDADSEERTFSVAFGIAVDDLRRWCAESRGCAVGEIMLWFE